MVSTATTTELQNKLRDDIDSEVTQVAVGTGMTDPTKNDTSLEIQVAKKAVGSSVTGAGEVTHITTLLASEANGNDLTEAGDLDVSDNLEARYVHAAISKTSDITVEYRLKKTVQNQ